jgi:hypothetical protein
VFGCACYPNLSVKATHKLAPYSTRCIFLRYSTDHKGYQCLDLTTNNIVISRHVIFYEVDFPLSASPRLTNDLDIFCKITLLVWLPCPHHCRRPVFRWAFHHWPQLAIKPHVQADRPHPEQRLAVIPRAQTVRQPSKQRLVVRPQAQAVRSPPPTV